MRRLSICNGERSSALEDREKENAARGEDLNFRADKIKIKADNVQCTAGESRRCECKQTEEIIKEKLDLELSKLNANTDENEVRRTIKTLELGKLLEVIVVI